MRILLGTHVFAPSIGGIESCSLSLALTFAKLGHAVKVITQTASTTPSDNYGLEVIRKPDISGLAEAVRWCDVYFQNNISLQTAWPLLFIRRPWIVCTQTWLKKSNGSMGLYGTAKRLALRFATNIYISKAIRNHAGHRGTIVPNPYDSEVFRVISGIERKRSVVFLGRLVSDKGCDVLIQSLAMLKDSGLILPLTVIGCGPEEESLQNLVRRMGLGSLIRFAGMLKGEELARELNRHEVLAVPSRWEEPFGMVALEGIACGCLVVGSKLGGLSEAIGPCGIVFENGNAVDLARAIREIVESADLAVTWRQAAAEHLDNHKCMCVASRYLEIFASVLKRDSLNVIADNPNLGN
jgi:glycosyltransferase involved in cell wall biosynthesis